MNALINQTSTFSLYTTLSIDAMYLHAARTCYESAKLSLRTVGRTRKEFLNLRRSEMEILERYHGDPFDAYDELERVYIQMEDADYNIGASYGPYFQNIALTHILCVTAAEAHINIIAKGQLNGKFWENFEKMSIEGKWLFLPKLLGNTTFNQGEQPFQSFSDIIKYRNALVHYKSKKEIWDGFERRMPKFLGRLGLSLREARKSIKTIKSMILNLSKLLNLEIPHWLREGYNDLPPEVVTNFFKIHSEKQR